MKKNVAFVLPAVLLIPLVASAQNFTYVNNWLNQGIYWLRLAITVVMIAMTLYFLWSVFAYIRSDAGKREEAKQKVISGLIGLFVSVAVWGIIRIAGSVLGVNTSDPNADRPIGITCPPGLVYRASSGTCERL